MTPNNTKLVERLKPCPFCKGVAYVDPNSSGLIGENWPRVRCHKCDATGPASDVMNDERPAIAAWNTRAGETA